MPYTREFGYKKRHLLAVILEERCLQNSFLIAVAEVGA
jgi:hypothetical protein